MLRNQTALFATLSLALSCRTLPQPNAGRALGTEPSGSAADTQTVQSAIPFERLSKIKAALPEVAFPRLQNIFAGADTFWYDHEAMTPVYQDSVNEPIVGVNPNAEWFKLLAASLHAHGDKIFDRSRKRWHFPFATTFGTDNSDNVQIANFLALPRKGDGSLTPVSVWHERTNLSGLSRSSWHWLYPIGATVGEIIFVKDGEALLPVEVRIRKRYASGWAANAFRPFPTAADLAAAIKSLRPNWSSDGKLSAMISHLVGNASLETKHLTAAGFKGTFDQKGSVDNLPVFGDPQLVRELLTKTPFKSAYRAVWRTSGGQKAYAASTEEALSIVPRNYEAGLVEVSDDSCKRCHQNTGNLIEKWFPDVVLYGEIWGKDGIFSFHPFDESSFPYQGAENRKMHPKLEAAGVTSKGDKPADAAYPRKLFGD